MQTRGRGRAELTSGVQLRHFAIFVTKGLIYFRPTSCEIIYLTKIKENLGKSTKIYKNQRKSTKINEHRRKSTKIYENLRKSTIIEKINKKIYENQCQ